MAEHFPRLAHDAEHQQSRLALAHAKVFFGRVPAVHATFDASHRNRSLSLMD
jgi:hypothetical protein